MLPTLTLLRRARASEVFPAADWLTVAADHQGHVPPHPTKLAPPEFFKANGPPVR